MDWSNIKGNLIAQALWVSGTGVLVVTVGIIKSIPFFWVLLGVMISAACALVIWREAEARLRDWRFVKKPQSETLTRHSIHSRLAHINTEGIWVDEPFIQFDFEVYSAVYSPIHIQGLTANERITVSGTECQDAPRIMSEVDLTQPGQFRSFSFKQSIREPLASRLKKELSEDMIVRGSLASLKYDATFGDNRTAIKDCWINVYGDFAIRGPVRREGAAELLWPSAPIFINQVVYPGSPVQQH